MPSRQFTIGDAAIIAAVSAVAYMVALAYRIGQISRLGLPVTLSAVRLSDAVIAGLFVFVGGVLVFILYDVLESTKPGLASKLWAICLILVLIPIAFVSLAAAYVVARLLWLTMGPVITLAIVGAFGASIYWYWNRVAPRLFQSEPKMTGLKMLFGRHPAATLAVILSTMICLMAFGYGWADISLPQKTYLVTAASDEVAVAVYDDRVILATIEPVESDSREATLTGGVRVVPLPSASLMFRATGLNRLHPAN